MPGHFQLIFLRKLAQHESWNDECDWLGKKPSVYRKAVEGLRKRGLVSISLEMGEEVVRITKKGKAFIGEIDG